MYKKLALIVVLFIAVMLPVNAAHANTYKTAFLGSVSHVVGFIRPAADVTKDVEPQKSVSKDIEEKEVKKVVPKKVLIVIATAYSSTPDQTDDTPCITSTGYDVCNKDRNVIAVSRDLVRLLGYGTQVRFPELYGDEIFHIEDTMNMRFTNRIDFHLDSREEAKTFGVKRGVKIEVI